MTSQQYTEVTSREVACDYTDVLVKVILRTVREKEI